MKKIWRVLRLSLLVFLILVLVVNLYTIVSLIFFKKELPKVAGFAQIVVISGSMEPHIKAGDLLIIRQQKNYEKQDVVTYRSNGALITHRIIDIDQEQAILQGDANNVADPPVALDKIEGKIVLRIPGAGNFILFLRTPLGILLMAVSIILIYFLFELGSKIQKKK